MTRYFLGSLAIEGFRGINNDGDPLLLKFKADAVNSIHAPNGVGKSSIFEPFISPSMATCRGSRPFRTLSRVTATSSISFIPASKPRSTCSFEAMMAAPTSRFG